MADDRFTPARERARREDVVAALRAGTLAAPSWLLCPLAERRLEIEHAVARAGGGFFRAVEWSTFATLLDQRLGLPFAAPLEEADRVLAVERRLEALAARMPSLGEALAADPFGVARSLLGVADTLRAHRWDADIDGAPVEVVAPPTRDVVHRHLALLAIAVRAAEAPSADGALDVVARMARVTAALRGGRSAGVARVVVDGVDRLRPIERALLRALAATGCAVDVAPWVQGWGPDDDRPSPSTAPTLRDAIEVGALAVAEADDRSVEAVRARDPHEEAELVARWIAERVARGERAEDFAVSVGGSAGAADRVARALQRWGVPCSGAGRVDVRATALWQVVRASVRLAWCGVDAVDLTTVLAAPGSGVWGSERDRFVAALRRALPATWRGVRDLAAEVFADDDEPRADDDEARRKRRADARRQVDALVAVYESAGPFTRLAAIDRRAELRRVVEATVERFVRCERFAEAVHDPRDQTVWLQSSQSIEAALRVALDRLDDRDAALPASAPGYFLAAAESLLGAVEEDRAPPLDAGVTILDCHAAARRRPRVLAVTGFVRGRHPAAPPVALLLGPQERAVLDAALGPENALPSDDEERAVAWRETQRLLALPTEELLLTVPSRGVDGSRVEPSLTWRDLLARAHPERRARWERDGIPAAEAWLVRRFPDGPRCDRARRDDAVAALGSGDIAGALAAAAPLAAADLATRDFFAAVFRPERSYQVGDLVRAQLAEASFSPRDLEAALTCRYRFLATAILGLRPPRVARAPTVSGRDRARVVRAALRAIDAREAAGEPSADIDDVLDAAIAATIPWAARAEAHGALEELRRGARSFLLRYASLRQRWRATRSREVAEDEGPEEFPVALDGGRTVRVRLDAPRVELRAAPEGESPIAVDFTLRALDGLPRLRDLGLDLDAALAPLAAEARAPGQSVAAFVRFSLAKPTGDVLAARGVATADDDRVVPFETVASATALRVERHRRIEDHRDVVLARLAEVFAELDRDDAAYAPHDEAEAERLRDGGARTCDVCDARLACRFRAEGG